MAGLDNAQGDIRAALAHGRNDADAHGNKKAVKKFDGALSHLDKEKPKR